MTLPPWWFSLASGEAPPSTAKLLPDASSAPSQRSQGLRPGDSPEPQPARVDLWQTLKIKLDVVQWRPAQAEGIVVRELRDHSGPYYVLKNPTTHTYLRLSPREYWLWERLDGQRKVQELVVAFFQAHGTFAFGLIVGLVQQLRDKQMLREQPQFVFASVTTGLKQRTLYSKLFSPEGGLLARQWVIRGLDEFLTRIYRGGGWIFYTRFAQILFLGVAVTGLYLFTRILGDARFSFLARNFEVSVVLLWLAAIPPVVLHELGHALTTKRFGREVYRGGLVLSYGLPSAFVDTSDIWLEGKRARLAVAWAGPYASLLLASLCSMLLWLSPEAAVAPFLFQMASIGFALALVNLNPVLQLDGYYLLSDALEITRLRQRALAFFRHTLIPRLVKRERLSQEETVFLLYGALTAAWTGYTIYLLEIVYKTRLIQIISSTFGNQGSRIRLVVNALLIISAFLLLAIIRKRIYRWANQIVASIRRTGIFARAERAGITVVVGAAALTFVPWLVVPEASDYIGLIMGVIALGFAVQAAFRIVNEMRGTLYARAWLLVPAGLLLLILAHILWGIRLVGSDQIASGLDLAALTLAGIFLVLNSRLLLGLGESWRAVSILLIGLGWSSLLATFFSNENLPGVTLHLFSSLLLLGGLLHWQAIHSPPLSEIEATHPTLTTNEQLWQSFRVLTESVLSQLKFAYGRGAARRAQRRFNSIARGRDWGMSFADGKLVSETSSAEHATTFGNMAASDVAELLAAGLDSLIDGVAKIVGGSSARQALARAYDALDWDAREVVGEYMLRLVPWAAGLASHFAETRSDVVALLERAPLFSNFTPAEMRLIGQQMNTAHFGRGEVIIRQGEPGDRFYILRQGRVQVTRRDAQGLERKLVELVSGDYFGEAALLTGEPRNSTIRAQTPVSAYTLDKKSFDKLVRAGFEGRAKVDVALRRVGLLRRIPIFMDFDNFELRRVAAQLKSVTVEADQAVFHQDDSGDNFYIVESGEVAVLLRQPNGEVVEKARLGPGEYFGETALLMNIPRTATVIALQPTKLLALDARSFSTLVRGSNSVSRALERTSTRRMLLNTQSLASIDAPSTTPA